MSDAPGKILAKISDEDCAELAVALGKIYSPWGQEGAAADYVHQWLSAAGFETEKIALLADRPNILGRLRGAGGGPSLIYNAHLDHAHSRDATLQLRDPENPILTSAWREGSKLFGHGLVNDKGPLAATMIAARAVKDSGVRLRGDLLVSAVVGEIDIEPVDEFEAPHYVGHDVGAQYLLTHGGIADYALNAEASDFAIVQMEAGHAFFKITVFGGPPLYLPFVNRPTSDTASPNAIVRASPFIHAFEEWALEYQKRHHYNSPRGTCIPKATIAAIRGGYPFRAISTAQLCQLYACVMMPPGMKPWVVEREIKGIGARLGLEIEVKLTAWRPGFEVTDAGDPLIAAIAKSHDAVRKTPLQPPDPLNCSMWRDMNVYNLYGIPSVCYGPGANAGGGHWHIEMGELADAARAYALTALHLIGEAA